MPAVDSKRQRSAQAPPVRGCADSNDCNGGTRTNQSPPGHAMPIVCRLAPGLLLVSSHPDTENNTKDKTLT
jgi:hypothetical protein